MARNGSGTYNLPSGNPVVTGTAISSSDHNTTQTDIATALTNSVARNGEAPFTADQPMGDNKLTGVKLATAKTDGASLANLQAQTGVYSATVSGTADVITITPSPALTAYAAGNKFSFIASGANTTNVTINVNGLGAKAVTKNGTTALVANDILSAMIVVVEYDGTQFQLITQANLVDNTSNQTIAGDKTFSGDNTHSGADTHTGIKDLSGATLAGLKPIVCDGTTADGNTTAFLITDPTAARTITFPDANVDLTKVRAASTTLDGVVELATAAELKTGTDTTRAVTVDAIRQGTWIEATPFTATSGTENTWSGVPDWVTEIKMMFNKSSLSGTEGMFIRLGDSGGLHLTNYSQIGLRADAAGTVIDVATTGFVLPSNTASDTYSGTLVISLSNSTSFDYCLDGGVFAAGTNEFYHIHGIVSLDTVLTQFQVRSSSTDTFDLGVINAWYR